MKREKKRKKDKKGKVQEDEYEKKDTINQQSIEKGKKKKKIQLPYIKKKLKTNQ